MLRRLIKVLLARKRGDDDHWRRLYERSLKSWEKERRWLLSQIAIQHGAAPFVPDVKSVERERVLTEEELIAADLEQQQRELAQGAAMDDFAYEVAQYNATRDPIWRPVVEQATKLREELKGRTN
jgi:hypothetical protein